MIMRWTPALLLAAGSLTLGCADDGGDGGTTQLVPTARDAGIGQPRPDASRYDARVDRPDPDGRIINPHPEDATIDPDSEVVDLDQGITPPDPDTAVEPPDPDQGVVPPDPDMAVEPPDDLPPDPRINAGWIGGPCAQDGDCDYAEAFCLSEDEGYPRGTCSQGCERFCDDRDGMPTTFCVDDVIVGQGACLQQCDYEAFEQGCRPGYHCALVERYEEPGTRRSTCLPGPPPPVEPNDCLGELAALGLDFTPTGNPLDNPPGRNDLVCDIDGPVRLASPIAGVSFRYVENANSTPLFVACPMAKAIRTLSVMLRRFDIVEVGHIGTYNCRLIAGTNSFSMHGLAMAIDLQWFRASDGTVYNVVDHWEHNTDNPVTARGRVLWEIGQAMYNERIFNYVLTPDYPNHDNHFHVDLTPGGRFIGEEGDWHGYIGPNVHGD